MQEYSYFRLGERSSALVDQVRRSSQAVDEEKERLRGIFNAKSVKIEVTPENKIGAHPVFTFSDLESVPGGWKPDWVLAFSVEAVPAKGSKDFFFLENWRREMERLLQGSRLEDVFETGEMPARDMPSGIYDKSFVRESFQRVQGRDDRSGRLQDHVSTLSYSNLPIRAAYPLDYMALDGVYYLRVPNDGNGTPVFIPPDSEPVDYEDMLALDRQDYDRRQPLALSPN